MSGGFNNGENWETKSSKSNIGPGQLITKTIYLQCNDVIRKFYAILEVVCVLRKVVVILSMSPFLLFSALSFLVLLHKFRISKYPVKNVSWVSFFSFSCLLMHVFKN